LILSTTLASTNISRIEPGWAVPATSAVPSSSILTVSSLGGIVADFVSATSSFIFFCSSSSLMSTLSELPALFSTISFSSLSLSLGSFVSLEVT